MDNNQFAGVMREIGRLEGQVTSLEQRQIKHETAVAESLANLTDKMDNIIAILNMSRGGWWVATKVLATVSVIAACITWVGKNIHLIKGP